MTIALNNNISGLMCIPPNDKRSSIYFEEMVFKKQDR